MQTVELEHVNFTASDPEKTANELCQLFDWKIRWNGASINNGTSFHVGSETSYVAIYNHPNTIKSNESSYASIGGLNHIAVVVDDLDLIEERVKALGYTPGSHADYEPGRRFYFHNSDNVEFEVVSYTS